MRTPVDEVYASSAAALLILLAQAAAWAGSLVIKEAVTITKCLIPPGIILAHAGSAEPPPGFLPCDGSAVSRVQYAALFASIGIAFGGGDGTDTFNLPDLRGRVPLGAGEGADLTPRERGVKLGSERHMLSLGEMPVHRHDVHDGGHGHEVQDDQHNHGVDDRVHSHGVNDNGHSHVITMLQNDSTWPNNVHGRGSPFGPRQNERTSHEVTNITIQGSYSGIGIQASHSNVTVRRCSNANINVLDMGSGEAHNNMQPSLCVNFFIKF